MVGRKMIGSWPEETGGLPISKKVPMVNRLQRESNAAMRKWKRETKEGNRFKSWEYYHRKKYLKVQELIDRNILIENLPE